MGIRYQARRFLNRLLHRHNLCIQKLPEYCTNPEHFDRTFFERQLDCPGIDFRDNAQLEWLKSFVVPKKNVWAVWPIRAETNDTERYFFDCGYFGAIDAEVFYAMIQHTRPRTTIEVGDGYSTRIARKSIMGSSLDTRLICIDPDPRAPFVPYPMSTGLNAFRQLVCLCSTSSPQEIFSLLTAHTAWRPEETSIIFF